MQPKIGLTEKSLTGVIKILNTLLSDEFVLYTKTLNFHWNVEGPQFNDLHKFFNEQYEILLEKIDDIAERIRALGGVALGSLNDFLKNTRLQESSNAKSAQDMLKDLLSSHESIIQLLRKDFVTCDEKYNDVGTNDFLTGLMEEHEKMAWMLRALLSGKGI
ncbi:MAG: DNA starvation/stationary phase protection protein [Deltaproteobacteria bacterium]|nr:DNA starvation/stationary phase protection protein [Deltaproteobacteria bacterium]